MERALGRERRLRMILGSSWSSNDELDECPDPGTLRVFATAQEGEMITVGVGEGHLLPGLEE